MAKTVELKFTIQAQAGAVRGRFQDVDEMTRIAHASSPLRASATIDEDGSMRITRLYEAPVAARGFLNTDTIELVERRIWEANGAQIEASVTGFPITITGTIDFRESGAFCQLFVNASVQARIGVASPLAEGIVRDRFIEAFTDEVQAVMQR